eukprot:TRINITY_DN5209_c0_g1_i1.p1 TRINITY_DN5209_c0_g1~~TRINITY_DN5209_c0_g1_i1.p1  ORF type:complete len:362 (+),score=72.84 TRINITY_DN5209_c0_g1_i1:175-1260(+)
MAFTPTRPLFGSQFSLGQILTTRFPIKQFKTRGGGILAPEWTLWKDPVPPLERDPATGWTSDSRRCGLVGIKLGMLQEWSEWFTRYPLTAIHVPRCVVLDHKTEEKNGFSSVVVGHGWGPTKRMNKGDIGQFSSRGLEPGRKIAEFRITPDAFPPIGTEFNVMHFLPGQKVDVCGISKGKGFAGGMKKWGFAGLPASHGVSISHRSIGSTGNRKTPGRVWKGKKMPGRMGTEQVTVKNLLVWQLLPRHNVIFVKGAVPGPKGGIVRLTDAKSYIFEEKAPPFPTYYPPKDADGQLVLPLRLRAPEKSPWIAADPLLEEDGVELPNPDQIRVLIDEAFKLMVVEDALEEKKRKESQSSNRSS